MVKVIELKYNELYDSLLRFCELDTHQLFIILGKLNIIKVN